MANLTPYLTQKYSKMIEEITADLGKTADDLAYAQTIVRALKNPDMIVNGFPNLTLDRVQVMETGEIRVIPPPPAPGPDTCTQDKNGKKPEKELANVS
jgi:hypothetical protein